VTNVEFLAILDRFFHKSCCITNPQKGVEGEKWWGRRKIDFKNGLTLLLKEMGQKTAVYR